MTSLAELGRTWRMEGDLPCSAYVPTKENQWRDLFFETSVSSQIEAKKVCATCPFQLQCLEDALSWEKDEENGIYGVVGGLAPEERSRLLRRGFKRKVR